VNSTSLGGNKYLNFALVCLVEIPGYTLAWVAMNRLGRRWSLAGSLLLCGVTCIAAVFVPQGTVQLKRNETWMRHKHAFIRKYIRSQGCRIKIKVSLMENAFNTQSETYK
jgi:hypothetical protein